jgi:hypothetical protein
MTQVEALQTTYNSSQWELELLEQAALEACQSIDEGAGQAGSSVASRLRALGSHVARRMRGVLYLGIQKALGVVQSHYRVDLAALATSYIIVDDLDDDSVEAEANRLDALAAPASTSLLTTSRRSSSRTLLPPGPSSPESSWALWPLGCSQRSSHAAYVIKQFA